MKTAKIFRNGGSQAVRLPKEFQFDTEDVVISKVDDVVVIVPKDRAWRTMQDSLAMFTDDFMQEPRDQGKLQERPSLD